MPKKIENCATKIVVKVHEFCQREKNNKGPLIPFINVRKRVAAITGICEKTVSTITNRVGAHKTDESPTDMIESSGRRIVIAVRVFCQKEKKKNRALIPFKNVRERVSALTGLSIGSITTIIKENEAAKASAVNDNSFTTDNASKQMDILSATEIVKAVREFCEKEKGNDGPIIPFENVLQRVAALTGLSEEAVSTLTEGTAAASPSQKISKPRKKKPFQRIKKNELHGLDLSAIKNKIQEMSYRKEAPTLSKMLAELKTDISFQGGRTTLWKIIREHGLPFRKGVSKKKVSLEECESNVESSELKEDDGHDLLQDDDANDYICVVVGEPDFPNVKLDDLPLLNTH